MSTRKKQLVLTPPERKGKPIKLRLDARTVVMVNNAKALAFWKQRYPNAVVLDQDAHATGKGVATTTRPSSRTSRSKKA
jgi:hypothetical protein